MTEEPSSRTASSTANAPAVSEGSGRRAAARPRTPERLRRVRRRLAGVVFLLVPALLVWLAIAVYDKQFSDDAEITVHTDSVGNEMHERAEVKVRGVVVGEVRSIEGARAGRGAALHLRLDPGRLADIPANVTARMLPTTVFGQRYVALVPPARPADEPLQAGATIPQDRSRNAVELEQVLDHLLPTLTAVQPAKLSATLSAVSDALDGRGAKLGDTLVTLDRFLSRLNPELPTLNEDIRELVKVSHVYRDAAPDLLTALQDLTTTSSTLAEREGDLTGLYGTTTRSAAQTTDFLRANRDNMIRLAATARPTLRTLARYAPAFPCTLKTLTRFVPAMDKALGKGTDEPGLHVNVRTTPSRGKYRQGKDAPRYNASAGPRCYSVPYLGTGGGGDAARRSGSAARADVGPGATIADGAGGLGAPNSESENRLVNELLAPELQAKPEELPDWSSVLTGPALRGTEVRLK